MSDETVKTEAPRGVEEAPPKVPKMEVQEDTPAVKPPRVSLAEYAAGNLSLLFSLQALSGGNPSYTFKTKGEWDALQRMLYTLTA